VKRAQKLGELQCDRQASLVVETGLGDLVPRQQRACEEGPGILVRWPTDVERLRNRRGQERCELRKDRDLSLRPRDDDLPPRKAEGVALVDDPDRVVPPVGKGTKRFDVELRELLQQATCERLVDDDLGLPDRKDPRLVPTAAV